MNGIPSRNVRYTDISRDLEAEANCDTKLTDLSKLPVGIKLVQKIFKKRLSYDTHKYLALVLTFFIYASYHASRRPLNVVKP